MVRWFEVDPRRLNEELDALEGRCGDTKVTVVSELIIVETMVVAVSPAGEAISAALQIICPDAFPALAPVAVLPAFTFPTERIGMHRWHINHDGSICFGEPEVWTVEMTLIDVVDKVGDWLTNYLALDAGIIDKMPDCGSYLSDLTQGAP